MVCVEGLRAWWGRGLAQHAGHIEAVLQQRQLKDPSQSGEEEHTTEERRKETRRKVKMTIERKKGKECNPRK